MEKFMKFLNEKLTPLANFFGRQRHLLAMQRGFMAMISFIFIGAVFMIIANPPVTADMVANGGILSIFSGWVNFAAKYKMVILIPFNMTMGMLGVIAAFAIAYNLASSYKMSAMSSELTTAIICMLTAAPSGYYALADGSVASMMKTTYLGSQGLFTAIVVAIVTVEVTRFCLSHHLTIRLPESVPPFISETFSLIIPGVLNTIIFFGGNLLIQAYDPTMTLPALIEFVLGKPLGGLCNTWPGAIALCIISSLFWCCGLHGTMILMPFTTAIGMQVATRNMELVAAGKDIIFQPAMFGDAGNLLGGAGNTFSFVLLCFLLAHSKQLKAFGKATIIPSFCRISEPVLYGAPIAFNPILMIPFIVGTLLSNALYTICCMTGLITPIYLQVAGTFPIFINSFIKCLDFRIIIFEIVLIAILAVVWYPFFKIYDSQLGTKEKMKEEEIDSNNIEESIA